MRYTEVRMTQLAHEILADLDKETVDFSPNYDETESEPVVMPTRVPTLLINGSAGIAVGMATNIPPHNLGEVIDACLAYMGLVEGEREFAAEPIDATWAPGAEAELLGKFAQMQGLKLIDLQVECRSTMCRFQLSQPTGPAMEGSPSAFDVLNKELGLKPRWMMSVVDRPGAPTGKSIAYLWRDGFARRDCFEDGRPTPCSAESDESGK
jgi:hypothetical protein